MARKAVILNCSKEEKLQLKKWANSSKIEKRLHDRSIIILHCLENNTNLEIAKRLKISRFTVGKWRLRFKKYGIHGLRDAFRPGKPKTYKEDFRLKILKKIEQLPPKGQATWDGKSLAKAIGNCSSQYVWKIIRKEGIQLQRSRSWCVSTDKEFSTKSADIIGLYLNPPQNAIVLCIDEKPSIQAIERSRGYVMTSSGKIVQGLKSTYKRNGTLNLFAALNIATGHVKTQTTSRKTREDFQSFLDQIIMDESNEKEIHIILDNYCTHKKNEKWLKNHPNVFFHYTPTSASWLNQVEIWFGILTRKALKNGSFSSKESLALAIQEFVENYHKGAKPFIWRKREVKGSQLRNTIMNLQN